MCQNHAVVSGSENVLFMSHIYLQFNTKPAVITDYSKKAITHLCACNIGSFPTPEAARKKERAKKHVKT